MMISLQYCSTPAACCTFRDHLPSLPGSSLFIYCQSRSRQNRLFAVWVWRFVLIRTKVGRRERQDEHSLLRSRIPPVLKLALLSSVQMNHSSASALQLSLHFTRYISPSEQNFPHSQWDFNPEWQWQPSTGECLGSCVESGGWDTHTRHTWHCSFNAA